jgi:hypothetical protein
MKRRVVAHRFARFTALFDLSSAGIEFNNTRANLRRPCGCGPSWFPPWLLFRLRRFFILVNLIDSAGGKFFAEVFLKSRHRALSPRALV